MSVDVTRRARPPGFMTCILGAGSGLLVQEWVSRRREGVSLFVAGDEDIAACGHIAHRAKAIGLQDPARSNSVAMPLAAHS